MLSIHCLFHNNLSRTIRPLGAELGITLLRVAASCCESPEVRRMSCTLPIVGVGMLGRKGRAVATAVPLTYTCLPIGKAD